MAINHDALDPTIQGPPLDMGPRCTGTPTPKAPALHLVATEAHTVFSVHGRKC